MPTMIKKVGSRTERRYTAKFEIKDRWDNNTIDDEPTDYENSDYDPTDDESNTSDPAPIIPDKYSISKDSNNSLDNDDAAIIINPAGVDQHGPISVVKTNHYNQNHNDKNLPTNEASVENSAINNP